MVGGQTDKTTGFTMLSPEPSDIWSRCPVVTRQETGKKRYRGKILQISDPFLALLGYSREELETVFNGDYYQLVHPEDRQRLHLSVVEQMAAGYCGRTEYRVLTKKNKVLWLFEYSAPVRGKALFCAVDDVTAQMSRFYALQKAQARLQNLLDMMAGGVVVLRLDKKRFSLVEASEKFFRLFGYNEQEYFALSRSSLGLSEAVISSHHKIFRQIKRWLSEGLTCSMSDEYKIRRKDGSSAWVTANWSLLSKDEQGAEMQVLITESTVYRMVMKEMKEDQRSLVVESVSQDILFDYEIEADTLCVSANYANANGISSVITKYSEKVIQKRIVHEKDVPAFLHLINNLKSGVKNSNIILRLLHHDGLYYWYHVIGAVVTDNKGRPFRVVGKAVNINRQKQEMLELVERAQRDPFTKLYNKTMTEMLVRQYLSYETQDHYALMVIDVDNFKGINDHFGHLNGDSVLMEVSRILKMKFESTSVVGRIGGDEFLVFLRGEHDEDSIRKRAEEICWVFQQVTVPADLGYSLSASVGVAVAPQDGSAYEELFHKADTALYASKHRGKNSVVFYSEISDLEPELALDDKSSQVSEIHHEISLSCGVDPELIFDITEMLLRTKGKASQMQRALQLIGRFLRVGRVYLAESSKDLQACTITCEWCEKAVDPISGKFEDVLYGEIGNHDKQFNECGLFHCYDCHSSEEASQLHMRNPSACSTLHCAVCDNQQFRGFIGCDDVLIHRIWSQAEMAALSMLTGLISKFLFHGGAFVG